MDVWLGYPQKTLLCLHFGEIEDTCGDRMPLSQLGCRAMFCVSRNTLLSERTLPCYSLPSILLNLCC
jgi:hypothetical protein